MNDMMKRTILFPFFMGTCFCIMGQVPTLPDYITNPQPLDFTPFESTYKGEEILIPATNYTPPDYWDTYNKMRDSVEATVNRALRSQNVEVEYTTQQGPSGIQFDNYSSVPTVDKEAYRRQKAKEQAERDQRDAERAAFFAKKRARLAEAAARAEAERIRKEQERLRIYYNEYNAQQQKTAGHYAHQQAVINQRSTSGREYVLNHRIAEQMESSYTPSNRATSISKSDIIGVIPKRPNRTNTTVRLLNEHAVPNTGQAVYLDYDARFDNWKKYEKEREKRRREKEVKKRQVEKKIWDKITATMDDGQVAALKYYLTENNETIYSPGEEGEKREIIKELPHAVKETEDYYAFLSDDGNKIFVVDKKMPMLITFSFDEHQWKDDNLYNEIKNGTLKDSYDFESNESAKLDLIDDRNIAELAPHAKVNLQLALIDNSSTLKTNFYYFPQTKTVLPGVKATPVVNIGGELSAGGKVSAGATAQASLLYPSFSIQGEAKASEIELQENVTLGAVVKYGDKYYLSSANLSGEMVVGYTVKKKAGISITKDADIIKNSSKLESDNDWGGNIGILPVYVGAGLKMVFLKDITPGSY